MGQQTTNLTLGRLFTDSKTKGYDKLTWVKRDSIISNPMTGKNVFEQYGVEFPDSWSLNSINIVAQKYFTGTPGDADREASLKALINRVVDTVTRHGTQEKYFDNATEAEDFREELKYILATQRAALTRLSGSILAHPTALNRPALVSSLESKTRCQLFSTGLKKKV